MPDASPLSPPCSIGWIGCGVMGAPMVGHLLAAGCTVKTYTRTASKAQALLDAGATWAATPAEAATAVDLVVSIVGYPADVRSVYFDDDGILGAASPGTLLIDMTTSQPALAVEIADSATSRSLLALDAPVSGGDVGARNATLAIMCGGSEAAYNRALPILEILGKEIRHMGEAGCGQHTKMANQILIAGTMIGVCESLLYSAKQGMSEAAVIDVIGRGAASSWSINTLGPRIADGDMDPGFFVEHFVKDMEIALSEARAINLSLPGLALVHQLYVALKAQGGSRLGTQALIKTLRSLNP